MARRVYGPAPPYPKRPTAVQTRRKAVAPKCTHCGSKGVYGEFMAIGERVPVRVHNPTILDDIYRCEFCSWPKDRPKNKWHNLPEAKAYREANQIDDK